MMELAHPPIAKAELLIRAPVSEVFEAFVDPAITSKFWFTQGSGRLESGKQVRWDWEMYGASAQVNVLAVEQDKRILIEWGGEGDTTVVEWNFTSRPEHTTFVRVTNTGFRGDGDEIVKQAIDATEAFTLVLTGLKALLEHNIHLNLVADHSPGAP